MLAAILKVDKVLYRAFRIVSITLLCLLFFLTSLNVLLRFFPIYSMGWFDEIVELSFAWLVFTTAAMLWRNREHPQIDFLEVLFEGTRCRYALLSLIECINILFLSVFAYYSTTLVLKAAAASPIFQITRKVFYIAMPVTGVYMTIVSLFFLAAHLRNLAAYNKTKNLPNNDSV
ncbi:TRAP transporter small permease [Cohaesibacter celericrescens]|uniref:TRAP transporter small permease n=1 Tax=Cohaesibacter celericrescens TaxID=2067669 RepID=UPI0035681F9A